MDKIQSKQRWKRSRQRAKRDISKQQIDWTGIFEKAKKSVIDYSKKFYKTGFQYMLLACEWRILGVDLPEDIPPNVPVIYSEILGWSIPGTWEQASDSIEKWEKSKKTQTCSTCGFYMDPNGCWLYGRKLSSKDMKKGGCVNWSATVENLERARK